MGRFSIGGLIVGLAIIAVVIALRSNRSPSPSPPEMPEAEVAQHEAEVRQELTDRMDLYQEAVMRGDVQTVASFLTSDARILGPGMDLAGEALHAFIAEVLPSMTVTEVGDELLDFFVHGDVAYGIYRYWETIQMEGQEPEPVILNDFIRWEKEDGVWKIDRDVWGPRDASPEEG